MHKNMAMFRDAMALFTPFGLAVAKKGEGTSEGAQEVGDVPASGEELTTLKRELAEMQKKLDRLG